MQQLFLNYGGGKTGTSQSKPKLTCWDFRGVCVNNFLFTISLKFFSVQNMCVMLPASRERQKGFSQELHPSFYRLVNSPCLGRHRNFLFPWISEPVPFHKMCFMSLLYTIMYSIFSSNKNCSHSFFGFISAIARNKSMSHATPILSSSYPVCEATFSTYRVKIYVCTVAIWRKNLAWVSQGDLFWSLSNCQKCNSDPRCVKTAGCPNNVFSWSRFTAGTLS